MTKMHRTLTNVAYNGLELLTEAVFFASHGVAWWRIG